jgi:hypothetical protein
VSHTPVPASQRIAPSSRESSASSSRQVEQAPRRAQSPAHQSPRLAAAAANRPDPQKVATARAALAQAERDVGLVGSRAVNGPPASEPQLGKLALLIHESRATNATIDRIGVQFGFPTLSALATKTALKQANPGLTRRRASALIDALQRAAGGLGCNLKTRAEYRLPATPSRRTVGRCTGGSRTAPIADHRLFFVTPNAAAARHCSKRQTRRLSQRRVRSILRALATLVCRNPRHPEARHA